MFKRSKKRKSNRLQGYDYSQNGYYFVTICVEDMECRFGSIENENIILSNFGRIALQCIYDLPKNYRNCFLDGTIIMPNHIHCIIIINNDKYINSAVGDDSHSSPVER
ncbi:MAG: transposase, partial [Candidatus Delongbacteria bacterium]|nr:transposase [Candidatus Delongbacteria bacterium]